MGVSGRGKAIANLVELQPNEMPSNVLAVKEFREDQFVVMLTTDGIIKKTRLSEFRNVRRGGINAINLRPKSDLFSAQLSGGKNTIVIGTPGLRRRFFGLRRPAAIYFRHEKENF